MLEIHVVSLALNQIKWINWYVCVIRLNTNMINELLLLLVFILNIGHNSCICFELFNEVMYIHVVKFGHELS